VYNPSSRLDAGSSLLSKVEDIRRLCARKDRRIGSAKAKLGLSAVAGCALIASAHAQTYTRGVYESGADNTAPDVSLDTRFTQRQLAVGAQIGSFSLYPSFQVDESLNDNIFATQRGALADSITTVTGRTSLDYSKGLNTLDVQGWLAGQLYAVHSDQDAWQGSLQSTFTSSVHDDLQLVAKGQAQRLVDPRTDPSGVQGLTPTTYQIYSGSGGAVFGHAETNLLDVRIGANRISYDPLQGSQGPVITSDRDNTEIFGDISFRHSFAPRRSVYVKARPNTRNYDQQFDQAGFQRSSNGVRVDAGVDWDIDSVFLVNIETGLQHQAYDDPRFGTINKPDARLNISWWPTRLTNVTLNGLHEYYEAFFTPSPGAVRNKVTSTVTHELQRRWLASASFSFERDDLVDSPTHYTTETAQLNLKYLFSDGFSAGVNYIFAHQNSTGVSTATTTGATSYQQNIVTFTVNKLF
jgi:hypothetical protein